MLKIIVIIKYIFTLVGIGMIIGAFLIYKSSATFVGNAIETQGKVIELVRVRSSDNSSYYYKPVVTFKTSKGEAVEFTSSSGSNPASFSVGEEVPILYLPAKPQEAKIKGFFSLWGAAAIVGGIGSVFFLVGIIILLVAKLKNKKEKYLKQYGTPIETRFQSVQLNKSFEVNGRNPFQVLTQWQNPSTSEIHVFKSNNIWFDPTDHINDREITVYIEKNNPKKYFVDLSFLPKATG